MASVTITIPNTGSVITRLARIAQDHHNAKYPDPANPAPTVTVQVAVKEMILDYLQSVVVQDATNEAAVTAASTITNTADQAKTDAAGAIT